eukprot:6211344-Pyramimonas_sp.AAC.1
MVSISQLVRMGSPMTLRRRITNATWFRLGASVWTGIPRSWSIRAQTEVSAHQIPHDEYHEKKPMHHQYGKPTVPSYTRTDARRYEWRLLGPDNRYEDNWMCVTFTRLSLRPAIGRRGLMACGL